jgi:elongation factor P hydroxylase
VKRSPMKRTNPARKKREHARAYGPAERIVWLKSLPCFACGYHGPTLREVAHVVTGGTGRKADADKTVPLCPACHRTQHAQGWDAIGMTRESATAAAIWYALQWGKRAEG